VAGQATRVFDCRLLAAHRHPIHDRPQQVVVVPDHCRMHEQIDFGLRYPGRIHGFSDTAQDCGSSIFSGQADDYARILRKRHGSVCFRQCGRLRIKSPDEKPGLQYWSKASMRHKAVCHASQNGMTVPPSTWPECELVHRLEQICSGLCRAQNRPAPGSMLLPQKSAPPRRRQQAVTRPVLLACSGEFGSRRLNHEYREPASHSFGYCFDRSDSSSTSVLG
jgi:hypothetical protein